MDAIRLTKYAERLNIALAEEKAERLVTYGEALLKKNDSINLTAIHDRDEFLIKHLLDSLTAAALPEVCGKVADVGTGGGFPGVVVKIYRDELPVALIDSVRKKLTAVAEICNALDISVKTFHVRAEESGRGIFRDHYDTVFARAVAAMPQLLEYCLPLVKRGGCFIAMKGRGATDEIAAAAPAAKLLNAELERRVEYDLPDDSKRILVVYRKMASTPDGYPRGEKRIAGKPIGI